MTTPDDRYKADLILALRLHEVPGVRIGDVVAEIESHVAETGEDPRDAFGEPREYAARVAGASGEPASAHRKGVVGHLLSGFDWSDAVLAAIAFVSVFVLTDGVFDLGAGGPGLFGLHPLVPVLLGLAGCTAVAWWVVARTPSDRIVDPRTGDSLVPTSRGLVAVFVGLPLLALLGVYLVGTLLRS